MTLHERKEFLIMSSTQIDKVLNLYKLLYKIPSLALARIVPAVNNGLTIQSVWSQRNLERRTKQKFIQQINLNADLQPITESFPIEVTSELLSTYSDDEKLKAILRDVTVDGKSKQFIEIWDDLHLSKSYDLSAFDVHGDVYTDATFSSFHWSPDKTRLLYVAEKKLPKDEPFYKQKAKPKPKTSSSEEEEEPRRGTEYIYKPDWGEQLVGKHRSVIVILNIIEDTIVPVSSVPDDYFPAQVIWDPNGNDIVGVAHKLNSRYYGLYACTNRDSCIFHLKESEFRKLTADGVCSATPRFSPDGEHLIWIERDIGPAHHNVHRLMHMQWGKDDKPNIIVDLVRTHINIANHKKFYGLFNHGLPKRCWSDESNYIFLSTPQRTNTKSYIVSLENKSVTEIDNPDESSLIVIDVKRNYVAFSKFALNKPSQLVAGKFDSSAANVGKLKLVNCSKAFDVPNIESLTYEHTEYVYETNEPVKDFNFTYFGKKFTKEQSMPLIVALHGGPHTSYCNMFHVVYALLVELGFGVLQVNYRGSIGMGGDNVDYLLGKIGNVDVKDCMTAIDAALKKYPWIDPNRINLHGGSHGGFLGAHLSGQYPGKFKTAILLNPVIDIAAMFAVTDIPDWCRAESGCSILEKLPTKEKGPNYGNLLQTMLNHSPIIHVDNVKVPTLIALGSKDLRVPPSQGKFWYNRLKENNVTTKLLMYEDNHSLVKDEVEIDNVINGALWLMEHNNIQ